MQNFQSPLSNDGRLKFNGVRPNAKHMVYISYFGASRLENFSTKLSKGPWKIQKVPSQIGYIFPANYSEFFESVLQSMAKSAIPLYNFV